MTRRSFLLVTAVIGFLVGTCALLLPGEFLASKGVAPLPAPMVWMREVGVLILALGTMAYLARNEPDSPLMRAFLIGNAIVHAGLFPVELIALERGVITRLAGVAPNTVLHVVLAAAFLFYASRVESRATR